MTGFTIYETLRIFTPGALAVVVLDISLRLSTGQAVVAPFGVGPESVVEAIEAVATFVLLALILGLFLYLLDFPERLRIFKGDPTWAVQPSKAMKEIIADTPDSVRERYEHDALSLYFLFSDRYLPDDLHKRIYLFGAIYKIFVDLRLLSVAALVISIPLAISAVRSDGSQAVSDSLSLTSALAVVPILIYVALMGAIAARTRHVRHLENPSDAPTPNPSLSAVCVLSLFLLASFSIWVAVALPPSASWVSIVPALATLAYWFWFEVGPPRMGSKGARTVRWRDKVLMALGCEASDRPQFTSVQRTFLDIAVFGPFLVGASAAGALLGRSPSAVLAWGILIAPATLIMTNRKHEERLLGAYRHQVAWVHLHEAKIREILLGKAGFGDLEGPPRSARNLGKASPT
ncbi:MAG: hypothetical protein ACLFWH_06380 [Actinomycetota bacterium]